MDKVSRPTPLSFRDAPSLSFRDALLRGPGIHNHHRAYGFRARSQLALLAPRNDNRGCGSSSLRRVGTAQGRLCPPYSPVGLRCSKFESEIIEELRRNSFFTLPLEGEERRCVASHPGHESAEFRALHGIGAAALRPLTAHAPGGNCVRQCCAMSMPRQNQTPSKPAMCCSSLIRPPARPGRPISRSWRPIDNSFGDPASPSA
ncbi:hypothetical protein V1281_004077 [Nitrobacteraceae bacterium AZCC 2161]